MSAEQAPVAVAGEHDDHRIGAREVLGAAGRAVAPPAALDGAGRRTANRTEAMARVPGEERFRFGEWRQMVGCDSALDRDRAQIADDKVIAPLQRFRRLRIDRDAKSPGAVDNSESPDIGREIAGVLIEAGFEADVMAADDVKTLDGFDAVVLGSGVYVGHWLASARDLVERLADELVERPVWLFSSGPVGDPPKPEEDPEEIAELLEITHARAHCTFAGKLDKSVLGLGEKVIVAAVRVPEGDFRPWADVRAWATGIAEALKS